MTTGHDDLREALPDFVASRLEPEQIRLVQEHLAGCSECTEIVDDLTMLDREVRKAGEAMFEPHPDTAALRRHATEGGAAGDPWIRRHLELCAACSLEVETWARRNRASTAPRAAGVASGRWDQLLRLGLGAAAAVVLGVFLGREVFRPRPVDIAAPIGQPVLHVLPGIIRSGEEPRQEWTIDRSDPFLAVAVPISIPGTADEPGRFLFELRRDGGATVWSLEMTAARIRQHLDAADVVNIPDIPTRNLGPGIYEFLVRAASPPDAPPIYRAAVTISYRQSPADRNAPQ